MPVGVNCRRSSGRFAALAGGAACLNPDLEPVKSPSVRPLALPARCKVNQAARVPLSGTDRRVGRGPRLPCLVDFDMRTAYNLVNGVQARQAVDAAHGVSPP